MSVDLQLLKYNELIIYMSKIKRCLFIYLFYEFELLFLYNEIKKKIR
jgi:hypothetical protein